MFTTRSLFAGSAGAALLSAAALAQCPAPGNCLETHSNPGCDDVTCCNTVCSFDGFCCNVAWDVCCVSEAELLCTLPAGPFVNPCNGSTYYLLPPGSWTDAQVVAQLVYGGSLATINDEAENEFVRNQVVSYDGDFGRRAWIGYYSPTATEQFVWVSGLPGCYTNWYPGEPNNIGQENYTELWGSDGGWNNNFNVPVDGGPPTWAVVEVPPPPPPPACAADLNHDGVVDGADLGLLLSSWGPCQS